MKELLLKYWPWILALGGGFAIYWFLIRPMGDKKSTKSTTGPGGVIAADGSITYYPEKDPLSLGASGDKVKQLQTILGVEVDGKFGPITKATLLAKFGSETITYAQLAAYIASLQAGVQMFQNGQPLTYADESSSNPTA